MKNRRQNINKNYETIQIELCMGSSCFARGNREVVDKLKEYIKENDLQDRIDIKGDLCMDQCEKGPNMKINGKLYNQINTIKAIDLINSYVDKDK